MKCIITKNKNRKATSVWAYMFGLIVSNFFLTSSINAQELETNFYCYKDSKSSLIANSPRRGSVELIRWEIDEFNSGESSQIVCEKVAERFQRLYSSGMLRYIVEGEFEGQPSLCTSLELPEDNPISCSTEQLILTLRPGIDDPQDAILTLTTVLQLSGSTPLIFGVAEDFENDNQRIGSTTFFCDQDDGEFVTIANHPRRGNVSLITWRTYNFGLTWSPEKKCHVVSRRFQQLYSNNMLRYIFEGELNGYPVLCASDEPPPGSIPTCSEERLILTLRPGIDDPQDAISTLDKVRQYPGEPSYENNGALVVSSQGTLGIDFSLFLYTRPVEQCYFGCVYNEEEIANITTLENIEEVLAPGEVSTNLDIGGDAIVKIKAINYSSETHLTQSGFIFAHKNSKYYVITAIQDEYSYEYEILTADSKSYRPVSKQIFLEHNLLVLTFESRKTYPIVQNITNEEILFVRDVPIYMIDSYSEDLSVDSLAQGQIINISNLDNEFRYTNIVSELTRGGPIFDTNGLLVGISIGPGEGLFIHSFLQDILAAVSN